MTILNLDLDGVPFCLSNWVRHGPLLGVLFSLSERHRFRFSRELGLIYRFGLGQHLNSTRELFPAVV